MPTNGEAYGLTPLMDGSEPFSDKVWHERFTVAWADCKASTNAHDLGDFYRWCAEERRVTCGFEQE